MPELNIWERERNTAMKVFSRLYLGLKDQGVGEPQLGFATPYEENAAGRKRQETVDRWAGGYGEWVNGKHVPGVPKTNVMDNEPRGGFKITDDIKRVYWGGGNVVWRVFDPAGFELEIQSRNLMAIIQSCGINEGGEIPGRCVWGRSGGDNILLHESSDEYKDAVKAAETLKAPKQVSKAGRRVGGLYRRVNGTPAIFIGKVHVVKTNYAPHEDHEPKSYIDLKEGKCIVSRSVYDLPPSEPFEAMLEVEDDGNGGVALTTNLTLYKKAPCVDDLGDVDIPTVTDSWLMKLMWSFASSGISYRRIMSVTVNPILNPGSHLVEHLVLDEPKTVDEFYKFLDDLFAKGQLFYVTAKESYV